VLRVLRLVAASGMAACLVLGFAAIRRRDISAHRAWMVRAYAIGLAAGTQVFTEPLAVALFGDGALISDLAKGAGWVVNLAVAEWVLRRPAQASAPRCARRVVGRGAPPVGRAPTAPAPLPECELGAQLLAGAATWAPDSRRGGTAR
jgi:hypothetical protein